MALNSLHYSLLYKNGFSISRNRFCVKSYQSCDWLSRANTECGIQEKMSIFAGLLAQTLKTKFLQNSFTERKKLTIYDIE